MLAGLIGYFGDFDLAEEAAAEAFAVAAQRWPSDGMPDNPGAWLVTTAPTSNPSAAVNAAVIPALVLSNQWKRVRREKSSLVKADMSE